MILESGSINRAVNVFIADRGTCAVLCTCPDDWVGNLFIAIAGGPCVVVRTLVDEEVYLSVA